MSHYLSIVLVCLYKQVCPRWNYQVKLSKVRIINFFINFSFEEDPSIILLENNVPANICKEIKDVIERILKATFNGNKRILYYSIIRLRGLISISGESFKIQLHQQNKKNSHYFLDIENHYN